MYKIPLIIYCDTLNCKEKLQIEIKAIPISILEKTVLEIDLETFWILEENGWTSVYTVYGSSKYKHFCKEHSKK